MAVDKAVDIFPPINDLTITVRRTLFITFLILLAGNSFAQLHIFSIPKERTIKLPVSTPINARAKELAGSLPFWDDFSYASQSEVYPNDTLWQHGKSVWTNNGTGINPPSLGVATFDGIDSLGKPYSVNDILAKGIADQLVSRPLRMDLVEAANRGTVFLSFYFQFRGNGEPPDAGDQFIISIKNDKGKWDIIKVIENDGTLKNDVFYSTILPIAGNQYFHDKFQFRFQSFGRLSGPYDTWNLDYIYLNKGRSLSETTSFPDRTITAPLTAIFNGYWSIPLNHFRDAPGTSISPPLLALHNLEFLPGNGNRDDEQTINYSSSDSILYYKNETKESFGHNLNNTTPVPALLPLEFRVVKTEKPPMLTELSPLDTRVVISLKMWVNTSDNILPSTDPNKESGDYNLKYSPIDFRNNDTTRAEYTLSDYYAYDDGTAEYGASLVQPGSQLAYLFELRTTKPDTIVRIDLYFPKFGDETSQVMQLQILRDLTNSPGSLFYTENITIQRSQQNKFWRHELIRPIGVTKQFYIVLKQTSSSIIAIGLDKNTNSGQKMFFNSNGSWIQNVTVKGSLMIRPAFGKGDSLTTAIHEPKEMVQRAYPNPNNGVFFIPANSERLYVFDMTGRLVAHEESIDGDQKRIELKSLIKGIYILKIFKREEIYTQKIMVQD